MAQKPNVETTYEQNDDFPEDQKSKEEIRMEMEEAMQLFGKGLQRTFDIQVGLKEEIEQRWLDDLRHYNGLVDKETEGKINQAADKTKGSRIVVNLTRSKTNTAESKLSDLLLPTDDRNWGIKPTPVPELVNSMEDDSDLELEDGTTAVDPETEEPYTVAEHAQAVVEEAEGRAKAMEKEIDDQLTEANYNEKCRKVIHSACVLGAGIIKGPMVGRRKKRAWKEIKAANDQPASWGLDYNNDHTPTADSVDPWNFFPDMSAVRQEDWEFTFERHLKTKKQLRKLADQPGFMRGQIANVLREAPNARGAKLSYLNEIREMSGISQIQQDNRYEVVEYHGPIEKTDLLACGCKGIDMEDPMEEYEGVVWFCNHTVIKVGLHHMDDDSSLYNIFNWEEDEVSVWGFGVPYRMANPQKVMNASWRMLLDNAGLSTGPQILINKELVEPADGNWTLTPRKVWWITSKDINVRAEHVMKTFTVDSNQSDLTNIFQMAARLADEETSLPQLNPGNIGSEQNQPAAMKTLGGTMLWMTSNNIMLRRSVKSFDDNITDPFITKFYDWNMQFSKKEGIKGDYNIDARGTSVLLVKELQSRNITELINTAINLPGGAEEIDTRGLLEEQARVLQLPAKGVLKEKGAKDEEAQNQPPDPEMIKLQMQQEMAQLASQDKQAEIEGKRQIAMMEREVRLIEVASQEGVNLEKIRSDNQIKKYEKDWDIRAFYEEKALKQAEGATANYGMDND